MSADRTPAISIITPVWNGMPFLRECVESVLKQDFQDWELIISDDSSTDDSLAYLTTLKDPRIRLFRQDKNLGIFGNLNFIFRQACGPISQILCQDDYFTSSSALSRIIDHWAVVCDSVGYMGFNRGAFPEKGFVGFIKRNQPAEVRPKESDGLYFLFGCMPGNLSNVSLRTCVIKDCGWFREDIPYCGDFEFWARAGRRFNAKFVPDVVTFVRSHTGQASNHLNKNGEYYSQEGIVLGELFERLVKEDNIPIWMLRLHGTLRYHSVNVYVAIKRYLNGEPCILQEVNHLSHTLAYRLNAVFTWVLVILSIGGRVGPSWTAHAIMQRMAKGQG